MQDPTVSFIVPCYKLAHLLSECVESILAQTYGDFEVLIMDDCSPDNTAEVAGSFNDPRIRYIRNDPNLGPLRNYNKGIALSRGKYVWLISADDYLLRPYILDRYVKLLETHPRIGYVFCPGVGVKNGVETQLLEYSQIGDDDQILDGHAFVRKLLHRNIVLAPSALARRECYENLSFFPLDVIWAGIPIDMVWGGDWYLWLLFALFYDVGYFADPMVCYREHDLSMTNSVTQEKIESCWAAEMAVLWIIRQKANEAGMKKVSRDCLVAIAGHYAFHLMSKEYRWLDHSSRSSITMKQFEESLCKNVGAEKERNWIRAHVLEGMGDLSYSRGNSSNARSFYIAGLRKDPGMVRVYAKLLLLLTGKPGAQVRRLLRASYRN